MKKVAKICTVIVVAGTLLAGCATHGYFVVRERPVEPVYERPAPPPGAIWVSGEWEWQGGRYVYIRGHYVEHETREWIPGHWRDTNGGYVGVRGHWR